MNIKLDEAQVKKTAAKTNKPNEVDEKNYYFFTIIGIVIVVISLIAGLFFVNFLSVAVYTILGVIILGIGDLLRILTKIYNRIK